MTSPPQVAMGECARPPAAADVRPRVLAVDEVATSPTANVLYHIVNDRHIRRRAAIFTTNKHPKRWGAALHDEDLAEAIVDRVLERGRLLRARRRLRADQAPARRRARRGPSGLNGQQNLRNRRAEFPEPTRRARRTAKWSPCFLCFTWHACPAAPFATAVSTGGNHRFLG